MRLIWSSWRVKEATIDWIGYTKRLNTTLASANAQSVKAENEKHSDRRKSNLKLLRIPRATIPSSFFLSHNNQGNFSFSSFKVVLKTIPPLSIQQINDGPSWLQGEYPLGLLEKRHEKRRFLDPNKTPESGWREVTEEGDIKGETKIEPNKQSALIKRPLLVIKNGNGTKPESTPLYTYIPLLVITSKKAIDKRAVVRNKSKTRLLYAFEQALKSTTETDRAISWPLRNQEGLPFALVFFPTKEVIRLSMPDLIKSTKSLLTKIAKWQNPFDKPQKHPKTSRPKND